ncbi:helix-turn-helix domain-containing protein [Microbacterium arborescens]|uniref:helix-turn-helix domain-containing protein n=1 Tax=Microbacterium arborescens TaxID=33883 RepID=UPI00278232BE|nr:helix-turn-helix domain-containing protein [Microbacterium arborescens]MDQ1217983.1 excisionase family DNA binding protein [Microbacterium arborescens]
MRSYVLPSPGVFVPARVARIISALGSFERVHASFPADAEIAEVLRALRQAGEMWRRAEVGTRVDETPAPTPAWFTTRTAAALIGCKPRAVRRAIAENRLAAEKVAGVWNISAEAVAHFRRSRRR